MLGKKELSVLNQPRMTFFHNCETMKYYEQTEWSFFFHFIMLSSAYFF